MMVVLRPSLGTGFSHLLLVDSLLSFNVLKRVWFHASWSHVRLTSKQLPLSIPGKRTCTWGRPWSQRGAKYKTIQVTSNWLSRLMPVIKTHCFWQEQSGCESLTHVRKKRGGQRDPLVRLTRWPTLCFVLPQFPLPLNAHCPLPTLHLCCIFDLWPPNLILGK